jgi:hypothetical protein
MRALLYGAVVALLLIPAAAQAQAPPDQTVRGWYEQFLKREPDPGAVGWVASLQKGTEPNRVLADIVGSQEYFQNAGSTPQGFVAAVYRDLLGRQPTPAELDYWTAQFQGNKLSRLAYAMIVNLSSQIGTPAPPSDYAVPDASYYQAPSLGYQAPSLGLYAPDGYWGDDGWLPGWGYWGGGRHGFDRGGGFHGPVGTFGHVNHVGHVGHDGHVVHVNPGHVHAGRVNHAAQVHVNHAGGHAAHAGHAGGHGGHGHR